MEFLDGYIYDILIFLSHPISYHYYFIVEIIANILQSELAFYYMDYNIRRKKNSHVFTAEVDIYCRSAAAGAYFVKKP